MIWSLTIRHTPHPSAAAVASRLVTALDGRIISDRWDRKDPEDTDGWCSYTGLPCVMVRSDGRHVAMVHWTETEALTPTRSDVIHRLLLRQCTPERLDWRSAFSPSG